MNMTAISEKKIALIARVTSAGYQTTARDVAESQELVNQYIDELERLEKTVTPKTGIDVADTDGRVIHFENDADFAEWLAGRMQ